MRKPTSTNTQNQLALAQVCVLNDTLSRLALRWKMPILHAIAHGSSTYGALRKVLPQISHQMLATRLRELVGEGLVVKGEQSYEPTSSAHEVLAIMEAICRWELAHGSGRAH